MAKSVYIHIPFCDNICSYCDFCKLYTNNKFIDKYLNSLENEIENKYKKETIKTLYIGGGTPSSLNIEQLNKLFKILKKIKKSKNCEFTFECNIENITKQKLEILLKNNVNRISVGIQTFNEKYLEFLNRKYDEKEIIKKISLIKNVGFKNINVDLIYAIPGQTKEELEEDIDKFLNLQVNHISTYSLIIEPNTKIYIDKVKNIDEDLDYEMYKLINKKLKKEKFIHYELSNYSKKGYESKHNLNYWNNNEYYGFGLGASGFVDKERYENTRNLNKYINGIYIKEKYLVSDKEMLENEFILGLRKIKGINKKNFQKKYGDINNIKILKELINKKKLIENKNYIYINPKYLYIQNSILINFIDS